jgi:integrase
VFERRPGLWVAKKPIGKRGRNTLYLERTGKTQAEAIRRRDAALPPGPTTTVSQWAERWLADLTVKPQSKDAYAQTVTLRIAPELGHRPVAAVTPYDVERAAAAWGKRVGANTVRRDLARTRIMFGAAIRAGLVAANPVVSARKPKATKVEIDPFTADELARVVRAASAGPKLHRLAVMAAVGCRIGEAIALRQSDYDPATGLLSISRTRTIKYGDGPPKSANGTRAVRVPEQARRAAAALGVASEHRTTARRWDRLLAGLGLRPRNPHQARHSVATLALAAGVPLANVARDLGDTVATVVATYVHPTEGRDVCDAIEGLLGGGKVAGKAKKPRSAGRKRV